MNYGYVYKTTNLINRKIYIGQNKGDFTSNYLGSGIHVKSAINKYGRDNFKVEVIAYGMTKQELDQLEIGIIALCKKKMGEKKLYNISSGGEGNLGVFPSKYTRLKMRRAKLGKLSNSLGHINDKEAKAKISLAHKDKPLSKVWKRNISLGLQRAYLSGRKSWNKGIKMWPKGRVFSEIHCINLSKACKGRIAWNKGLKLKH